MLLGERTLNAEINSWEYAIRTAQDEEGLTGRHLLMIGETVKAHFLWPREFNFEISEIDGPISYQEICHEGRTGTKYGEMVRHDYDSENKIPEFVHGGVSVSKDRFNHILELLLSRERIANTQVFVRLKLFGLELGSYSIEEDKWPTNRKLAITDLELSLQKAKEE